MKNYLTFVIAWSFVVPCFMLPLISQAQEQTPEFRTYEKDSIEAMVANWRDWFKQDAPQKRQFGPAPSQRKRLKSIQSDATGIANRAQNALKSQATELLPTQQAESTLVGPGRELTLGSGTIEGATNGKLIELKSSAPQTTERTRVWKGQPQTTLTESAQTLTESTRRETVPVEGRRFTTRRPAQDQSSDAWHGAYEQDTAPGQPLATRQIEAQEVPTEELRSFAMPTQEFLPGQALTREETLETRELTQPYVGPLATRELELGLEAEPMPTTEFTESTERRRSQSESTIASQATSAAPAIAAGRKANVTRRTQTAKRNVAVASTRKAAGNSGRWGLIPYIMFPLLGLLCFSFFAKKRRTKIVKKRKEVELQRQKLVSDKAVRKTSIETRTATSPNFESTETVETRASQDMTITRGTNAVEQKTDRTDYTRVESTERKTVEASREPVQSRTSNLTETTNRTAPVSKKQDSQPEFKRTTFETEPAKAQELIVKREQRERQTRESVEADNLTGATCSTGTNGYEQKQVVKKETASEQRAASTMGRDQFTQIEGINAEAQQALYDAGYYRFSELGNADQSQLQSILSKANVEVNPADTGNWIRLATVAGGSELVKTTANAQTDKTTFTRTTTAKSASDSQTSGDDLTQLQGVGAASATLLNKSGISTFEQLVQAGSDRLSKIFENYGGAKFNAVDTSQWIPQAEFAMNNDWNGLTQWLTKNRIEIESTELQSGIQGRLDDLTQIKGIGPATQDHLRELGICTIEDIAKMSVKELSSLFSSTDGRFQLLEQETWPQQAQGLLKQYQSEFAAEKSLLSEIKSLSNDCVLPAESTSNVKSTERV